MPTLPRSTRLALLLLAVSGCGGSAGASKTELGNARGVGATGAVLYERTCESCHGKNGEGSGDAPSILGKDALSTGKFETAEDLFNYVAPKMPKDAPGSLDMTQYWNIVTFMVATAGHEIPDGRLSESNAASVKLAE